MPTSAPPTISTADVRDLRARPDSLFEAARGWRAVAGSVRDAAEGVDAQATAVQHGWVGPAADSFDAHRRAVSSDLHAAAESADRVAGVLDNAGSLIGTVQRRLTEEWRRVVGITLTYDAPMHLVFAPRTADEENLVIDSMIACEQIRAGLDGQLAVERHAVDELRGSFHQLGLRWQRFVDGLADPFDLPPDIDGFGVIRNGNQVVVNTGAGDDMVQVDLDPVTGLQVVTVNGERHYFGPGVDIVVRAGFGNDTITVAPGTRVHLTLIGGDGADQIHGGDGDDTIVGLGGRDRLFGGAGNDRISAGADRDYIEGGSGDDIIDGGRGDDTAYGLDGNDVLDGGEGQDYLEGAAGDDRLFGGSGNDILSGGTGGDTLHGGSGDDVLYAGRGGDLSVGGPGSDTAFSESGDATSGVEQRVTVQIKDLGTFINVQGSPDFQAHVQADLELLRSSPDGQQMLTALDYAHGRVGESVTIQEYADPTRPDNSTTHYGLSGATIAYNRSLDEFSVNGGPGTVQGPPVVVLYHELAHTYDYMYGTFAPGTYTGADNLGPPGAPTKDLEREAVGLPIDGDNDPSTPPQLYDQHPYALTENGLRAEMGAPHRDRY